MKKKYPVVRNIYQEEFLLKTEKLEEVGFVRWLSRAQVRKIIQAKGERIYANVYYKTAAQIITHPASYSNLNMSLRVGCQTFEGRDLAKIRRWSTR